MKSANQEPPLIQQAKECVPVTSGTVRKVGSIMQN